LFGRQFGRQFAAEPPLWSGPSGPFHARIEVGWRPQKICKTSTAAAWCGHDVQLEVTGPSDELVHPGSIDGTIARGPTAVDESLDDVGETLIAERLLVRGAARTKAVFVGERPTRVDDRPERVIQFPMTLPDGPGVKGRARQRLGGSADENEQTED